MSFKIENSKRTVFKLLQFSSIATTIKTLTFTIYASICMYCYTSLLGILNVKGSS